MRRHEIAKASDGFYYCELEKVESIHNNVRTKTIAGIADFLPKEGRRFVLFGEPLSALSDATNGIRIIETTPVASVEYSPEFIEFKTANSVYRLKALDDKNLCKRLSQLPII